MKIDRHNYEECFILYMDNELSSDDRRRVEEFIQQNPDLKEELDILFQYKMTPDTTIVFDGKDELVKQAGVSAAISLANYEEWLVMYLDGELNTAEQNETEQFIRQHPSIKKDLVILQKTKLQPGAIVFPGKESLYRRTEKVKVIAFNWRRIAVAAILLIALSTTALLFFNNKPGKTPEEAANNPVNVPQKGLTDPVTAEKENAPTNNNIPVIANTAGALPENKKQINPVAAARHNTVVPNKNQPGNSPIQTPRDEQMIAEHDPKPSNNLPQPINPNRSVEDAANRAIASIKTPAKELTTQPKNIINTNPDVTPGQSDALQIANRSTTGDIDFKESGGKKSKLRGFFRKITRTFQKNTNAADEDRLLVGGLAIKLK